MVVADIDTRKGDTGMLPLADDLVELSEHVLRLWKHGDIGTVLVSDCRAVGSNLDMVVLSVSADETELMEQYVDSVDSVGTVPPLSRCHGYIHSDVLEVIRDLCVAGTVCQSARYAPFRKRMSWIEMQSFAQFCLRAAKII